ncbi:hypothetical protein PFFVO_05539 [Plasmodium falciparum Vietnam Oak-Knoll (FVO)]|uniref:Uncharacterized protein n=1 Tax=Plasmodium falciparum Vietnam Oak-Knoll (FVO) TaxID=1036723 RepID=A0A024UZ56_PLAFA|nr:hypothetical protein PFFVO_05539 [Plasmodium falciparum Vietnam Oak-Knoll (FVO)]
MKVKIGSFENFLERLNNIKEEDIIINDENTEEMFSSFLITFYKENEGRYTIQEQEYINNLLNILINKIRDNKNGRNFFSNLLCIHFKSITPYFINVKLKDNIYYIHLLINYILYVLNLVIYIEKENKELSLSLSIGRNIYTLTLYIIRNIKQNRYDNFYLKIIEEGKLIYLLCKICYDKFIISYYIPEDNVVELFFVLIKIKELEKYIIECDIIKYFLSFLLYDPQVIKKRKHLIIEIIIHMFLKNISIIKDFIKQNIIDILNNILKSIYNNIKCDHYDYYCINLLKIFYYIIQDKNIVNLENNFFSYPKNTSYIIEHEKNNNILIFYKYINNIINKINDVIKQNMSCKDSANIHILNNNDQLNYHFKYFLSILLCVIKSIITRIFQGKNNIQDSPSDDDKREEVYEEIIKLVNVTFEFVILYFILEWTQIHPILKKLQIYISKNKLIFHVLFKIWKDIEYDNKLKNIKVQPEEINVMYRNNNQNVQFILFRIIKMLTKNFTQYIDYIINNKDLFSTYKNIIIYESKTILTIYEQIRDDMNEEHVLLHREEENLLLKFVNLYKEDIKKFERIFENVATFYNKKDNMELQNYYDYLRENKGIE